MRPYQSICSDIEEALHRQLQTPKDFDFLRQSIYARLHIYISQSTLMRLWGYVDEPVAPRISTLNALAQYLGYQSWEDYETHAGEPGMQQSRPVMNRSLNSKRDLHKGQRLRLTWQPDRICDIEYLGDLTFRVIASENTRLLEGDTFECWLFIEGEPLYLENLHHQGLPPCAYVCGEISGVRFEEL